MSTVPETVKAPSNVNKAMIAGRIDAVRQFEMQGKRAFETRVVQPAPDEFSSPTAVAIISFNRLGTAGEDVKVLVSVQGFKDHYTDKKTGEAVQTARNSLRAVE